MNVIAFILLIVAAAFFVVAAWTTRSLIAVGLTLLTVGLIFQFAATAHTFTF